MMNLLWKSLALKKGLARHVPAKSGVYVIRSVKRVMNLPVTQEFIYIGKSVNLQRRYKEHCSLDAEHNAELLTVRWNQELGFWYAFASKSKISELEKQLISQLDPKTNIIKYQEKSSAK